MSWPPKKNGPANSARQYRDWLVKHQTGADRIVEELLAAGVQCVFGLPGTQTVELFEALRNGRLRTVLATSEIGAAFMAGGWARATISPGVLLTIPGPGFTWALTGIAEARLDSIPLLHISGASSTDPPGRRFRQQEIAQSLIAGPLVKAVIEAGDRSDPAAAVRDGLSWARSGEPGPVLLHVSREVMTRIVPTSGGTEPAPLSPSGPDVREVRERLRASRRPIFFIGQGVIAASVFLRELAEQLGAPVVTTPSARGSLAEDHPLNLGFDPFVGQVVELNALLASADLIVVIGAKLGHNGTSGFKLKLPPDRLVHIDASADIIGANYSVSLGLVADAREVLLALGEEKFPHSSWTPGELDGWRSRIRRRERVDELRVGGTPGGDARSFFEALRRALPANAILVLDSGMHQILARRYYKVLAPNGLIFPSDFQSMGFAIPTAIGAGLAAAERPVVALVGDGGFAMTGLELLSAVREKACLVVIVFVDGALGQIRLQQLADYGATQAVTLRNPDFALLAAAIGARHELIGNNIEEAVRNAIKRGGVVVLEVPVGDSFRTVSSAVVARARRTIRTAIGDKYLNRLKRLLKSH